MTSFKDFYVRHTLCLHGLALTLLPLFLAEQPEGRPKRRGQEGAQQERNLAQEALLADESAPSELLRVQEEAQRVNSR